MLRNSLSLSTAFIPLIPKTHETKQLNSRALSLLKKNMEIYSKLPIKPQTCFFTSQFTPKASLLSYNTVSFLGFNSLPNPTNCKLPCVRIGVIRQQRFITFGPLCASGSAEWPSTDDVDDDDDTERWLLQPVGDGDTRHIGFKVAMPDAFEIASSVVTVGRLPEKADLVIPVATVSGVHARIKKKEGRLLVMDLDSTNGTFVNDKRLRPGSVAAVSSGSCITFGDTHLAMFRVSKLENDEVFDKSDDSEVEPKTEE